MNTGSSFKGNEISKKNIYIKRGEEEGKERKQRKGQGCVGGREIESRTRTKKNGSRV